MWGGPAGASPQASYLNQLTSPYLPPTRPSCAPLLARCPAFPTAPAVPLLPRVPTHLLQQLPGGVVDDAEAAGAEQHAAEPPAHDDDHVCVVGVWCTRVESEPLWRAQETLFRDPVALTVDFHKGQELGQFSARRVLPVVVAVCVCGGGEIAIGYMETGQWTRRQARTMGWLICLHCTHKLITHR